MQKESFIKKCVRMFFSFKGRIVRLDYLIYSILSSLFFGLLAMFIMVPFAIGLSMNGASVEDILTSNLARFIFLPFQIVISYTTLAISAKRFHDLGLSGWFSVLSLVPIASFVVFIILLFCRGQSSDNKYGTTFFKDECKSSQQPQTVVAAENPDKQNGDTIDI